MRKFYYLTLIIILIFLSLFPRSIEVLNKNFVFGFDQGRDYLAVKNIVVNHHLTLIGSEWGAGSAGFTGLFHGPFYYYFLSIPFVLVNGDPYGGVVFMFLLSILSIAFAFYFGRKVLGTMGGLFTSILIAISPPLISQARFVWNSYPSTFFILLMFYCVYKIKQNNRIYIFLAAFFSGFIYNFQTGIAIPLSFSLFLYLIFVIRSKNVKDYGVLFAGFVLAFSPFILFEIRHDFMGMRGLINYIVYHTDSTATLLFNQLLLKNHLGAFLYNFSDTFPRQNIVSSELVLFIVLLCTNYYRIKDNNKQRKQIITFLLMLPFVTFFVFSFLRNSVYPYYLIHLNLTYILLFSYILYFSFIKKKYLLFFPLALYSLILIIISIPSSIRTSINDFADYGGNAKIRGKVDAIDSIYKDAKGEKFGLLVFSPPVYTYPYDYIIKWYGQKKYGYVPHQEKKGLFYLLIEVDPSKQWSYNGWLETVIKDGKIIKTYTHSPSGFIIQKRIVDINEK